MVHFLRRVQRRDTTAAPWLVTFGLRCLLFSFTVAFVASYGYLLHAKVKSGDLGGDPIADLVVILVPLVLGWLIERDQPGHRLALLFLVMAYSSALGIIVMGVGLFDEASPGLLSPGIRSILLTVGHTFWVPGTIVPIVIMPLFFPDGRLLSSRWRAVVVMALSGTVGIVTAIIWRPWPWLENDIAETRSLNGITGSAPLFDVVTEASVMLLGLAMILAIVSVILRFRRSRGKERRQMKWPVLALAFMGALALSYQLVPGLRSWDAGSGYVLTWSMAMLLPVSIGIAILRHNLLDIDLLIYRTVAYGTLTALIVGLYVAIVGLAGLLFQARANVVSGLVATGVVAVLFQPIRERLRRHVDRLFYGEREDPSAILTRLADQVQSGESTRAVLPNLVQTIAQALKVPFVAIQRVGKAGQMEMVAGWGEETDQAIAVPLTFQAEHMGKLVIGRRGAGERFSRRERQLLGSIAAVTANAVHAVDLAEALRQSRQRIVTAREEERRRLRRDLHDGLGPQLASQTLGLKALEHLLVTEPERAQTVLASLMEQSQEAIEDVRRLVYELRPPTLDNLGLVGALRQSAARLATEPLRVTVEVPEPLPELSAAIETAVFRISQEAMTNVVRHAGARHAVVRLRGREGQLCVEIRDDGRGFSVRDHAGIGLESMRERAAELNGSCVVESRPGEGTTVTACLPLEVDDV